MKISSPAFENSSMTPKKYTCSAENVNPPLRFADIPAGAKSLALIMDAPDAPAGTYTHWVVWNIPPKTVAIDENSMPPGTVGKNSAGTTTYIGPCPPSGTHRYFFKLYALDLVLSEDGIETRADLEQAMQNHILAEDQLRGLFKKS